MNLHDGYCNRVSGLQKNKVKGTGLLANISARIPEKTHPSIQYPVSDQREDFAETTTLIDAASSRCIAAV